jgi:hypothetical protein
LIFRIVQWISEASEDNGHATFEVFATTMEIFSTTLIRKICRIGRIVKNVTTIIYLHDINWMEPPSRPAWMANG